jgi:glycine cleavage system H protein
MNPADYRYTKEHQWTSLEGPIATIGITDYGQEQLGDIVFVQLPKVGARLKAGEAFGSIESVKAVNHLFALASGKAYGTAWFLKLRVRQPEGIPVLTDAKSYEAYTRDLAE